MKILDLTLVAFTPVYLAAELEKFTTLLTYKVQFLKYVERKHINVQKEC